MIRPDYPLDKWDVLQLSVEPGVWLDYSTIRSAPEGDAAVELVREGQPGARIFRIVRNTPRPGQIVLEALEPDAAPRCECCRCPATLRLFGFAVCDYHVTTGEDGPSCPSCHFPREVSGQDAELLSAHQHAHRAKVLELRDRSGRLEDERSASPLQRENARRARRTRETGGRE